MMIPRPFLLCLLITVTLAFTIQDNVVSKRNELKLCMKASNRRHFLAGAAILSTVTATQQTANAVERAVGSAELQCRKDGDCLEKGEWDGAVGWQWGGKDRCDATDPRCGPDGVLRDEPVAGEPVPDTVGLKMTHQVELTIQVGKEESGILRMGLYGDACPKNVALLVDFFSSQGLATSSKLMFEQGYGITAAPVSMAKGGMLTGISPGQRLDFGIPSQAAAYARSKGISKAGDDFVPQPRPKEDLSSESFVRRHDTAGLVSIPGNGLGFGGNAMLVSEDEAFADSFQLTASAVPAMDKEKRRVVGQLLDNESMSFLARLASLPTKKGFKGVVPGLNDGPPLVKTTVRNVQVKAL